MAMTADELLQLGLSHKRTELVQGQLVVREPAGYRHGEVAARLLASLYHFVDSHALGRVLTAETGFVLRRNPDTVRAADVAFVRQERVPVPPRGGFAEIRRRAYPRFLERAIIACATDSRAAAR